MSRKNVYRVFFTSQGKAYEIFAQTVEQADLYGFIQVEGLLFGEKSELLLDPSEEGLKNEFQGVHRLLIPFHQISRIDEVVKEGRGKIVSMPAPGGLQPCPPVSPFPKGDGNP